MEDFCREIDCYIIKLIDSSDKLGFDEEGLRERNCQEKCKAYKFQQWLKSNDYCITESKKDELIDDVYLFAVRHELGKQLNFGFEVASDKEQAYHQFKDKIIEDSGLFYGEDEFGRENFFIDKIKRVDGYEIGIRKDLLGRFKNEN